MEKKNTFGDTLRLTLVKLSVFNNTSTELIINSTSRDFEKCRKEYKSILKISQVAFRVTYVTN